MATSQLPRPLPPLIMDTFDKIRDVADRAISQTQAFLTPVSVWRTAHPWLATSIAAALLTWVVITYLYTTYIRTSVSHSHHNPSSQQHQPLPNSPSDQLANNNSDSTTNGINNPFSTPQRRRNNKSNPFQTPIRNTPSNPDFSMYSDMAPTLSSTLRKMGMLDEKGTPTKKAVEEVGRMSASASAASSVAGSFEMR
ncbi:hypothetical protein M011DRAFT_470347 [Sporormia fimetaria CBS 119925]|uniref:Uncharacterized protein n=1 Tax=Sporormia fimetaria CBS 119925 TaxID=1340428 RepID=A0A6A6V208_9PLEO|nr:hypothetical protein M011DRAFT_470347 [Sporormia fimetaria CBS 119925]